MSDEIEGSSEESPVKKRDLGKRTKAFALDVIDSFASLPSSTAAQILGRQMLRSGTSVGAHYREANRSRSTAEFISKLESGLQELDETSYWLELLEERKMLAEDRAKKLLREADELTAILVRCCKNAKAKPRKT